MHISYCQINQNEQRALKARWTNILYIQIKPEVSSGTSRTAECTFSLAEFNLKSVASIKGPLREVLEKFLKIPSLS